MSPGMWNGRILALAFLGQLVAVGEALQNEAALGRAVALPHEVLTGANCPDGPADSAEHVLLVVREDQDAL